jgi:hypothetical protein
MCETLLVELFGAPVDEVAGVEGDAKEVGGDESELSGADADDTDDGAIDSGDDPTLPKLFANEHGGEHGQDAGQIVETNHIQQVQHSERANQSTGLVQRTAACSWSYILFLAGQADCPDDRNDLYVMIAS